MNDTIGNPPLTRRQLKIIPLLISENTHCAAAAQAGIARSTLYRWLADPNFKAALQRQVRDHTEQAAIDLKTSMVAAVGALRSLLESENEHIRLRSAVEVISYTAKFMEMEAIEERIEALEEKANTA